jgi:DNA-binding CsgD family transcriptional regulator
LRFRDANASDIPAIVETFDGRNALPLETRLRQALPALLRQLMSSQACTFTVFEDEDWQGPQVVSFAAGLLVRDAVIEAYLAAPEPRLVASILASVLDGGSPLLTLDEIRHANSGDGLQLVLFPIPLGRMNWDDPQLVELRRLAPQALLRSIGGYRLRAIYYEVFTDEAAAYIEVAGYRRLHDYSAQAGTGILTRDCRPCMLRLTCADLPPAAMSMASQMFNPPPPRLGLTLAEQRVALRALDGASDRSIAESLGLSGETVRSNWRSIYRRLSSVLGVLDAQTRRPGSGARGYEKRRVAVEYLRQNLHELRPSLATAQRGPGQRPGPR